MKMPLILLAALTLLCPLAGLAQADFTATGSLDPGEPTYRRAYVFEGQCFLSSIGSAVRYDVVELVLDFPGVITSLEAETCSGGAEFDSVIFLYQRPDGGPGAFDPSAPCQDLLAASDDACGYLSRASWSATTPGHVDVVITTWRNGDGGAYSLAASSAAAPLERFLFYSGFEQGDARAWSATAP